MLNEELIPQVFDVPWDAIEITSKAQADELIARARATGQCAVDTETTGLNWTTARAFMVIFSPDLDTSYACWNAALSNYIMEAIQGLKLIFHNFKFDAMMLYSAGIWQPEDYLALDIEDTMLMARIMYAMQGNAALKVFSAQFCEPGIDVDGPQKAVYQWFADDLARRKAEKKRVKGKYVVSKDMRYDTVPKHLMFPYATQDTALTIRTYKGVIADQAKQRAEGERQEERSLRLMRKYECEVELTKLLVHAELHGWHLNRAKLQERMIQAQVELQKYMDQFAKIAPGVDIFSSKQLQKYVYETLNEPVKHLTKKGNPSVDESALSDLAEHPVEGACLVKTRQWKKLKDKCEELLEYILDDDAVHSDLKIGGARTGRFSSANPALQNIANYKSIDTGGDADLPWTWIRDLFCPEEGYEWLLADYSQIEVRVAAHYAKDLDLISAIAAHLDLHRRTASMMFGVAVAAVTKMQRSFGKVMMFTLMYGGGVRRVTDALRFGSAQCDPVPIDDARRALLGFNPNATIEMLSDPYPHLAKELYNAFRSQFPLIMHLKSSVESVASQRGYIVNAFGREIPISRESAYKALNYLIQGSAADLMKEAMLRAWAAAKKYAQEHNLRLWKDVALFMTIHDEIIIKCPVGHAKALALVVKPALEDWPQFRVPIEVEFAHVPQGSDWAHKKGFDLAA